MSIFYKFKSAKNYKSITLNAPFISVGNLNEIFQTEDYSYFMRRRRVDKSSGEVFYEYLDDILYTNTHTNEEYVGASTLIPKNTSLIIRKVPKGYAAPPLLEDEEPIVKVKHSTMKYPDDLEMDDFGEDVYAIPNVYAIPEKRLSELSDHVQDDALSKIDEEQKIKALMETTSLEWQRQFSDVRGPGRGFGRGTEQKTPPEGYVCHRCNHPGHFIQHCPTNGDPDYDIKRARPRGGVVSVIPDEAVFEKEFEGLFSKRSTGDLPPELLCPLCKEVMKDAVLTSKCCFKSFCDKCIRDLIVSKSMCICGATNVLADHLVPNMTLRDTISRMSESDNSRSSNGGSASHVYTKGSHNSKSAALSSAQSEASKGEKPGETNCKKMEARCGHEIAEGDKEFSDPNLTSERLRDVEVVKPEETHEEGSLTLVPENEHPKTVKLEVVTPRETHELISVKEPTPVKLEVVKPEETHEPLSVEEPAMQGSLTLVSEKENPKTVKVEAVKLGERHEPTSVKEPAVQESLTLVPGKEHPIPVNGDAANKKKRKKAQMSMNGFDLNCVAPQYLADGSYMMSVAPAAYNPYWAGSYNGAVPYMGFGCGPFPFPPYAGVFPQDPSFGPVCPLPFGQPQSKPADLGVRSNDRPVSMSRYEIEVTEKGDLKRKREITKSQDRPHKQVISSGGDDGSSMKLKYVCIFYVKILFYQLYLCRETERGFSCGNFLAKCGFGKKATILEIVLFHFISLLLFSYLVVLQLCLCKKGCYQRVRLFQAPCHVGDGIRFLLVFCFSFGKFVERIKYSVASHGEIVRCFFFFFPHVVVVFTRYLHQNLDTAKCYLSLTIHICSGVFYYKLLLHIF